MSDTEVFNFKSKNEVLEQKEYEDPLADMTIEELELKVMKEKATRCKVIALESLGHHPLANPTNMGRRDKKRVLDAMTLWFSKTNEEIETEFNDIIDDKLLGAGTDYTKYAIENNNIRIERLPDDMKGATEYNAKLDEIAKELDAKEKTL